MAEEVSGPLSPERNESIFCNDILPDHLPDAMRSVDHPRLILLGGQPGAGKTAVLIASHADLEQSGSTVRIVGDDLRSAALSEVLGVEREEQIRRFNADPVLKRELDAVSTATSARLSLSEIAQLRKGNFTNLAAALGINTENAASLQQVHRQVKTAQETATRHNRNLSRSDQIAIRR